MPTPASTDQGSAAAPASDGDLGSILGVFAHPDDEVYLAGALMALAVDAGRRVVCVTATRGEHGFPDDDPRTIEERMAVREAELAACLAELGVTEHRWLGYPDGGCADVADEEPVATIAALIDDLRPDTLVTFGPDGQTYHDDHIAVSRWSARAVDAAAHTPRLLYATMTPAWVAAFGEVVPMDQVMMVPDVEPPTVAEQDLSVWFVAEGELLDRKVRALRCQASQVAGFVETVGVARFGELTRDEFFRDPTPEDWPPPTRRP